ncbi:venom carboxylesterase-6-like [Prorops nasuta]|uniref:venom carboxylesterase-6-like n=1 Tax=Prorops nasuta TaxID=863751 RepID=UPI0034D0162E
MCIGDEDLLISDGKISAATDKIMSSQWLAILCSLASVAFSFATNDGPMVTTSLGPVKGIYELTLHGRQIETYRGIPYALPPSGKLRFKPPVPIPQWTGVYPATEFSAPCIQYLHASHKPIHERVLGSEDCLYLNVHVPVRENGNTDLMPVIFWIHGGAFQFGTGKDMGPKFLLDRDVILVTINYRLGPFGFLSTEDTIVPGNMGLKDQSMALNWTAQNIQAFGGDPNKITLVGLSAGGASVHYQYLSPLSAGLFQRGISLSGTALDCWTQTENSLEKAKKLASLMGCSTINNKEMIRCLRYRPARTVSMATVEFMPWMYNPYTPFGPVVEKSGVMPFISRSPVEIINDREVQDVPWITGVVSEEGLYPAAEFVDNTEILQHLDINWNLIAPHLLDYNYTLPQDQHVNVAQMIRKQYLDSKPINTETAHPLVKLIGDRLFVYDSEKAARLQAKVNKSPVWYYYFSYRGASSLSDYMSGTNKNFGVCHADDAYTVLNTPYMDPTTTTSDLQMQSELIDFWVSFANNGIPEIGGVEWPKMDPLTKELHYLHIAGPDKIAMETNDNFGQKQFWTAIKFNENISPNVKSEL